MSTTGVSEEEGQLEDEIESTYGDEEEEQSASATHGRKTGRAFSFEEETSLTPNGSGKDDTPDEINHVPTPDSILSSQPPWPEWSDDFINEEIWDIDRGSKDFFEDSFTPVDLLRIKAYRWMRPADVFREPPSVVTFNSLTLDLISPNAHLCEKSEAMRYILGEISELYDYSMQNKFECEGEGIAYVPNYPEDDRRWTPWSHIYSCCKAGVRGERPMYNPKGKYYVRLYFMGAWRRIPVDDRIPVLPTGRTGLPLTGLNELWPMLLAKALLKVAIVTWHGGDVKRFSTISSLTGWVFEWIDNIDGVNEEDLWTDLENILPKFKDPTRVPSWNTIMNHSKKKKFGNMEGIDSFWWMPPLLPLHSTDLDNIAFHDFEHEPLQQTREIVAAPLTVEGEERPHAEYRWKRLALEQTKALSNPGSKTSIHALTDKDDNDKHPLRSSRHASEHANIKRSKRHKVGAQDDDVVITGRKSIAVRKVRHRLSSHRDLTVKHGKGRERHREKVDVEEKVDKEKDKPAKDGTPKDVEQATTGEEEETAEVPPQTKVLKAPKDLIKKEKHWAKVKAVVTGKGEDVLARRKSKSIPRGLVAKSLVITPVIEINDGTPPVTGQQDPRDIKASDIKVVKRPRPRRKSMLQLTPDAKLPSVPEILYGVQKYAGIDYMNIVKSWENICGKDVPIALVVVLKLFPKPQHEDDGIPEVPSFLQHPIQLTEVRDTHLPRSSGRPSTPLWKRFRWKAWAMRKGLIPMEEDHSKDALVHAIKAKTPFVFKTDWYEFRETDSGGQFEEMLGEDEEFVDSFFFTFKKLAVTADLTSTAGSLPPASLSPPTAPTRQSTLRQSKGETPLADSSNLESAAPTAETAGGGGVGTKSSHASGTSNKRKETLNKRKGTQQQQQATSTGAETASSTIDEKMEGGGKGSQTEILHETQLVRGESEEDFDDGSKRHSTQIPVVPTSACGTVWFNCEDLARNLHKFCKFYTSTSVFGSCYILRREPSVTSPVLDAVFHEIHSELPKYPSIVTEYKQKADCINTRIEFDRFKSYHVTNYHLDEKQGLDSGFYMFSDCWTEQELIISVLVLQEECMKQYTSATMPHEDMPAPPPTPNRLGSLSSDQHTLDDNLREVKTTLNLNLILEPWDWRKDSCLSEPLICTSISDNWIVHVRLPAGRNTFRIWLTLQNSDATGQCKSLRRSNKLEQEDQNEFQRRKNSIPFSVRIVSQTPIYVGSRVEVQNYMTNPPMLFLKQCERLANNLWGLFACFGKQRSAYQQNLKQLRRSYCPAYSEPNMINKFMRGTHDTFEELFVSMITQYNEGKLDRMLVLTLRVLFLNPMIGRQFTPKTNRNSFEKKMFDGMYKALGSIQKGMVLSATIIIQNYYRGWRVRRLFQLRNRSHPKFRKIEYNVRKIAYLLARETDSVFTHPDEYLNSPDDPYPAVKQSLSLDPDKVPPTIMPNPPHWAVDLLKFLMEHNPWLVTIHPHAFCVPHHVKIQEVEGELPHRTKNFSWYPFFREVLQVAPDSKSCFCEIDLQVFPVLGIYMKVINNDNGKSVDLVNDTLYLGRLLENKHGYTILCYRWAMTTSNQELNERAPSKRWKLRVVTPQTQDVPRFLGVSIDSSQQSQPSKPDIEHGEHPSSSQPFRSVLTTESESVSQSNQQSHSQSPLANNSTNNNNNKDEIKGELFPSKLCLRRLTGYYIPNKDFSVCRYLLETEEKTCSISLRFRASYEKARIRIQVWDCAKCSLIFEETCEGGLIAPCIQLNLTRKDRLSEPLNEDFTRGDLVKANAMLLEKKNSGEKPASEEKGSGSDVRAKKRYIISAYIVENSWPLTDREWVYVLYKKRKFFKGMRRWDYKDCERRRLERTERTKNTKNNNTNLLNPSKSMAEEDAAAQVSELAVQELTISPTEQTISPVNVLSEFGEKAKELLDKPKEEFISTKRKKTKPEKHAKEKDKEKEKPDTSVNKDSGLPPTADNNALEVPGGNPQSAQFPTTTPPPTTNSNIPVISVEDEMDKRKLKIKRRWNGSLIIKYGGRQSQYVRHFDQPHWILEILTDSKVKYKLKSNRQILRKRLLQAKESWEQAGGFERLDRALCHRRAYLLENLIPINYNLDNPFSIIDPITNLYSCLRLEEYDLNGYTNRGFVEFLQQSWSSSQEQKKNAVLNLQKHKKFHSGKIRPYGMDYLPRNLRKRVEKYRQIRAEANELEKQMGEPTSPLEDEHTEKEEGDATPEQQPQPERAEETQSPPDHVTLVDTKSERPHKKLKKGGNALKTVQTNVSSLARKKQDAETKSHHAGKEDKPEKRSRISNKSLTRSGSLTTKGKKQLKGNQSTNVKGVEQVATSPELQTESPNAAADIYGGDRSFVDVENVAGESENEQDGGYLRRFNQCLLVGEIFRRYEAFFNQPITIREGLLDIVSRSHLEDTGPNKLVLTRDGIGKYCEAVFHMSELRSSETLVAEKFLKWVYDYSCLQPSGEYQERIEDPGELPPDFIKAIVEDPRVEEELANQQNEERYPFPPPRKPTHVLIGPKIKDCALDTTSYAHKDSVFY